MADECSNRSEAVAKTQISQVPDWSENAVSGDHIWMHTSISGDFCYAGDSECTVSQQLLINF